MTVDETEIMEAAMAFYKTHKGDVLREVDRRIEELHRAGETKTHLIWLKIRDALLRIRDAEDQNPD